MSGDVSRNASMSRDALSTRSASTGRDASTRRDALRFERLVVRRMPGVEDGGFRLEELSPGLNIVYGPNASGKTTTARAIEALLWPRAAAPERASLAGWFRIGDDEWMVEMEAGRTRWQRGGAEASAPPLPPAETRDRYRLTLHELLAAEDRGLAEEILRESAGGYDLARAARTIGAQDSPSRPTREVNALKAARERVHEARKRHEELRHEESELASLHRRLEAAEAAGRRAAVLELAIEHADAVAEEADARRALDAFPAAMALLKGDEAERLGAIRKKIEDARRAFAVALHDAEAAEDARAATGLPGEGVPPETLIALRERVAHLTDLRRTLETCERELEKAVAARDEAARQIGVVGAAGAEGAAGSVGPGGAEPPGSVALDELADFARDAADLLGRKAAADAELRWLSAGGEPDAGQGAGTVAAVTSAAGISATHAQAAAAAARARADDLGDALDSGAQLLRRWLRAPGDAGAATGEAMRRERRVRTLGMVAAAMLLAASLAGAWLAATAFPGTRIAPVLGVALAVVALLILGLLVRIPSEAADARAIHRAEFERLRLERFGVEGPGRWTENDVAAALDRLERRLVEARMEAERARRLADAAERRIALDPALDDLERRRAALAARLGVRPETDPGKLVWLTHGIVRWHEAAIEVAAAEAKLAAARAQLETALAEAWETIAPYGVRPTPARDAIGAAAGTAQPSAGGRSLAAVDDFAAAVAELERAARAHEQASREAADARRRMAEADEEIAELEAERRALLERLGLGPDDEPTVRQWCERFDEYLEARERLAHATRRRQETLDRLSHTPGYEPGLEDRDAGSLHDALEEVLREAEQATELQKRITSIETLVAQAKRSHDLEAALADLARAEDALRQARDRDTDAVVAGVLVDFLQRATRDQHRPEVFGRARDLFARITHGRYRLDFDDGEPPAFRAYDAAVGIGRALDELSSGTRVQLLLAVRIAFAESRETGPRLPLLLDETLGNSDDERARAIMETAIALAADGRQVFYFTAQPDEVGKWRGVLAKYPGVPARFIDLAEVRRIARAGEGTALPVVDPPTTSVPAPGGASYLEYGRILGVPPIDIHADPGTVHLWHLLDDPERLYRLLSLRVETWGALRNLVEYGGLALLGDDAETYARVEAAARALEAAVTAARIGRGRPVDRAVLVESGAISETFLDAVDALCRECLGDAARLIEALDQGRIARFRKSAREALRDYLERHGYLDPRDRLAPDQLRARVLAAAARDIDRGLLRADTVDRIIAACVGATAWSGPTATAG